MNSTTTEKAASGYAEIASDTLHLFVEAIGSYNERTLNYAKSIWEIATRPLETGNGKQNVRDGFERADQVVSLTVKELETSIKKGVEFAEKLIAQSTKLQQESVDAFRTIANKSITNAKSAVESAGEQFETLGKRMEEAVEAKN